MGRQSRALRALSILSACAVLLVPVKGQPADPDAGWKAFFGNLHAHTGVSDGVERPEAAYEFARKEGKIDFLCLSEHNHLSTQAGLDETDQAASTATSANFVGLVGQEFSVIDFGNHVNIYDVSQQIPKQMNSNYRKLFGEWLQKYQDDNASRTVVAQFNHAKSVNKDYGIVKMKEFDNYGGNWDLFVKEVDPWVSLIAVISGPADSNWPKDKTPIKDEHRDMDENLVRIWHTYLDKGMHLSPTADQDNHRLSWGTRTKARTGVWVNGAMTRTALLTAMKEGRAFASEDPSLKVWFSINGQPMGSQIPDPGESDLSIMVRVTNDDEAGSRYIATLYREVPGDGERAIPLDGESEQLANGEAWRVLREHLPGVHEAFIVHVRQVEAGNHVDDAWTAPIWIVPNDAEPVSDEPTEEGFVRSKNSKVYHVKSCAIAKQIQANGNLVPHVPKEGDGTRLHKNCPASHEN